MTDLEFEILHQHRSAFRLLYALQPQVLAAVESLHVPANDGQKVFAACLAARIHTNTLGCTALARAGLSAELQALMRVGLEAVFKLKAICLDADLSKVYANESLYARRVALKAILDELKEAFSTEQLQQAEADRAALEDEMKALELPKQDRSVAMWARDAQMAGLYRSLYAVSNSYVHSGASSLRDWVTEEDSVLCLKTGPFDIEIDKGLLAAAANLHTAWLALSALFHIPGPDASFLLNIQSLEQALQARFDLEIDQAS